MNIAARTPLSHATNKPSGEKPARIAGSSGFPIQRGALPGKALGADLGRVQAWALLDGLNGLLAGCTGDDPLDLGRRLDPMLDGHAELAKRHRRKPDHDRSDEFSQG